MSLIAEIRAQMARESGPVHPRHLAEVLEQDVTTVRNTMNQAATKGHGIERLDDGKFSLIPGWAPARGPNATAEPAAAAPSTKEPLPRAAAAPSPKKPAPKAEPAKQKRAYTRRATVKDKKKSPKVLPKPSTAPKASQKLRVVATTAALPDNAVFVSRSSLKALVSAVLEGEQEITPSLRAALREATHQTAAA